MQKHVSYLLSTVHKRIGIKLVHEDEVDMQVTGSVRTGFGPAILYVHHRVVTRVLTPVQAFLGVGCKQNACVLQCRYSNDTVSSRLAVWSLAATLS